MRDQCYSPLKGPPPPYSLKRTQGPSPRRATSTTATPAQGQRCKKRAGPHAAGARSALTTGSFPSVTPAATGVSSGRESLPAAGQRAAPGRPRKGSEPPVPGGRSHPPPPALPSPPRAPAWRSEPCGASGGRRTEPGCRLRAPLSPRPHSRTSPWAGSRCAAAPRFSHPRLPAEPRGRAPRAAAAAPHGRLPPRTGGC